MVTCILCGKANPNNQKYCINCKMPLTESRLINDWLWDFHRTSPQWKRQRMGPIPTHELGRMYMVILRYADIVLIEDGQLIIVEAKLRPNAEAIGQLQLYSKLIRLTPEFEKFNDLPIKLILLTTMLDLPISELCSNLGITYEIYPVEEPDDESTES